MEFVDFGMICCGVCCKSLCEVMKCLRCTLFIGTTAVTDLEDGPEEVIYSGTTSQLIPKSYEVSTLLPLHGNRSRCRPFLHPFPWATDVPWIREVESLLTQICDTTSIAEFELKLDGFRLYVTRDLTVKNKPASPPISAPVSVNATVEAPDINGSVSLPSVPISKPVPPSTGLQRFLDKAADEGLVMLKSPRVGYFRRSRTIKGKRAPPPCGEGQPVKEGKPLCYIEQLGGQVPVVSEVSGEVIKILREDGDPVGYGDALIAILPSFPGIKKLK
ncbi:single hybrid motif superfamily protein [Actinidia rufa]|uniref:Single hybrid motif superfamily protein n=1 Tax=Actinidia rufa TaxID=165716 RepID=A0A7J0FGF6_9ERIC|nr:single hybrid motif superfamily protein [Actinidia rufa]